MRKGGNEKMKNKFVLIRYVLMLWMLCGVCHTQSVALRKSTLWDAVAAQEEALPEMADLHTEPRILPHQSRWLCHQCRPITSRLPLLIGPTQEQAHNPSSWRRMPHTHRRLILRMKMTLLVRSLRSPSAMPPGCSCSSSLPDTSFSRPCAGV